MSVLKSDFVDRAVVKSAMLSQPHSQGLCDECKAPAKADCQVSNLSSIFGKFCYRNKAPR